MICIKVTLKAKKVLSKRCIFAKFGIKLVSRIQASSIETENVKLRIVIPTILLALLMGSHSPAAMRGLQASPYTGMSWYLVAFELGPWDEYLLHEITPSLERLTEQQGPRVSWLNVDDRFIIPDFAISLLEQPHSALVVSLRNRQISLDSFGQGSSLGSQGVRFEQSMLMPGLTHRMSERSAVTVSAILASQRYGAGNLNFQESEEPAGAWRTYRHPADHNYFDGYREVSQGAGIRLAMTGELLSNLTYEAAFQSRIEMAELASLQGFHGARAELDIPSRIQVGMQLKTTERSSVNLGVSQIFYSEVGAFPSRALPARFNALLGDSSSPQFDWDDLLVYSVGWQWQPDPDLSFHLDYYTRTQPRPSSPVLASALGPELAQNAFMAGFTKGLGERTQFRLSAAYAPPEFAFGGNVMGIVSDHLNQRVEVEASLSFDF